MHLDEVSGLLVTTKPLTQHNFFTYYNFNRRDSDLIFKAGKKALLITVHTCKHNHHIDPDFLEVQKNKVLF